MKTWLDEAGEGRQRGVPQHGHHLPAQGRDQRRPQRRRTQRRTRASLAWIYARVVALTHSRLHTQLGRKKSVRGILWRQKARRPPLKDLGLGWEIRG